MRVCLSCRRASSDDAVYCTGCGGMLGKQQCPKGHDVPLDAMFCPTCRSNRLSVGVPCWNLGTIPRFAFVGAVMVALAQGVSCSTLPERIMTAFDLAGNTVGAWWCSAVCSFVSLAFTFSVVYLFLPEEGRKRVEALLKLWLQAVRIVKRNIVAIVKPPAPKAASKKK